MARSEVADVGGQRSLEYCRQVGWEVRFGGVVMTVGDHRERCE